MFLGKIGKTGMEDNQSLISHQLGGNKIMRGGVSRGKVKFQEGVPRYEPTQGVIQGPIYEDPQVAR